MVNLSLDRISRTAMHNPSLGSIKTAMEGAKDGTFVRAKKDDDGHNVIYGHKGGVRSLFNRANPEREQEGTRQVAQAIRNFVSDKSPQTRELAEKLLAPYCDKEGHVAARLTNTQIIDIIDQVELTAKSTGITNFISEIQDGHNLTNAFFHHMESINDLVKVGPQNKDAWNSVCKPELFVGLSLALPDDLTADNGRSYPFDKLDSVNQQIGNPYSGNLDKATAEFKQFFMTEEEINKANAPKKFMKHGGEMAVLEPEVKIVKKDISKTENLNNFLNDYCNNIKENLFCTTSFEEWATDFNRKLEEKDNQNQLKPQIDQDKVEDSEAKAKRLNFVTSPNDPRAPIFLNEDAQAKLEGFDDATGTEKLDMLRDAFSVHMTTPSTLEVPPHKTWTEGERAGVELRRSNQTPAEALVSGLNTFHSVLF